MATAHALFVAIFDNKCHVMKSYFIRAGDYESVLQETVKNILKLSAFLKAQVDIRKMHDC
jgi:acyl-CoA thioesterase